MRRGVLGAFLLLFTALCAGSADRLDLILAQAAEELSIDGKRLVVSLGNITYADKGIGSSFSRYLEERLVRVLQRSDQFEVFSKGSLEEILEAIELSLTDLFDPETTVETGKLRGIQALIGGRFFKEEEGVRAFLTMISVETGTVIASTELSIPRSEIPETISILPDNYNEALFVLEELYEVQNAGSEDFVVKMWTTRGEGATYSDGEELVINVYASKDCYIKIYQVDVENNIQLIFPNPYFSSNFLREEKIYKIPDSSYPFKFVLGKPYGTEFIKAIASTVQFKDIEESFESIGNPSKEVITRGLSVKQREELLAEAMIIYTIIE